MVLTEDPKKSTGQLGGHIAVENRNAARVFREIFFNLCKACDNVVMSCIPPSAFSAKRIRESQQQGKVSTVKNEGSSTPKYFNTTFMELSPLKYNSKLMNSIWGFYNRYSPHNVKKVCEANAFSGEMQQSAAFSSGKNEPVINIPSQLDNVWAAINVSQTH